MDEMKEEVEEKESSKKKCMKSTWACHVEQM